MKKQLVRCFKTLVVLLCLMFFLMTALAERRYASLYRALGKSRLVVAALVVLLCRVSYR